ncbi:MAG: hydantoinase/oxoprolinase family protein, partial [Thermomicrobiales bacterium]
VALAEELDIMEVIVPWAPGTFSASGMLQCDIRHDLARTFYAPLAETAQGRIEAVYAELEAQGRAVLAAERIPTERMAFVFTADLRYIGQEYFVNLTVPRDGPITDRTVAEMDERFHALYQTRYGHATPGAPIEIVNLRAAALGLLPRHVAGFAPVGEGQEDEQVRRVVFDGVAHRATILRRGRLLPGAPFAGPAVIEEETATTVLPAGWKGQVDRLGNLVLTPARR